MMKDDTQLAKWLNDETGDAELKQQVSQEDFEIYSKIKKYSAQLTTPDADMDAMYTAISARKKKQAKVFTLNPWFTKAAAILIVALCAGYIFYTTLSTTQMAHNAETTGFALPDNSQVVLNAGSSAEYKTFNWDNNRNITLNGEAWFKVAKGKKFNVVTSLGTVTVVGTQFNVKARNKRLDVTCFEGKVKVTANNNTVMLTPGKSASFESGSAITIPDTEAIQPGWAGKEITYVNEKPENIIAEIERQYNVTIQLNTKMPEKPLSTTIPTGNLTTALDQLTSPYGLKHVRSGDKIILSRE